jgi:RNA polymerase sigma-70 factor (ECF subfamily)
MNEPSAADFPTTNWSRIVRAGDPAASEAQAALTELCRDYWYPLYALIRRRGLPPEEAADLTQDYFARLLESGLLAAADRRKGRFRAFLRTDCGFFLADRRDRDRALKRGGGSVPITIDARDAEGRYRFEPADDLTPERLFDRAWALTLLDRVLQRLATEYADSGRGALFEGLQGTLAGGSQSVPHAALAARLGTTLAAVQQAASRLRKRYREVLRAEIAATLEDPSDAAVADEVRDLFAALES